MIKKISAITFLTSSFKTLRSNPQLFYPFIILLFINFLILEILYFIPRYPLSTFFTPIVTQVWGDKFMHYPMNLVLLPKLFYYAQIFVFLLIGNFILAVTAHMVAALNNEQRVSFKNSLKACFQSYIYIFLASVLTFLLFKGFDFLYNLLVMRAFKIQSTQGVFFMIKKAVILGVPFVQFLFGIIITVVLAYVIPIIVIEKKKLFAAIVENFKILKSSFIITSLLVVIPTIFYVPVLLLRNNVSFLASKTMPEIQLLIICLGIAVTLYINTLVMTATSTFYLYKKDNK